MLVEDGGNATASHQGGSHRSSNGNRKMNSGGGGHSGGGSGPSYPTGLQPAAAPRWSQATAAPPPRPRQQESQSSAPAPLLQMAPLFDPHAVENASASLFAQQQAKDE